MTEKKHNEGDTNALRSSSVQEILGLVPNWMIRFGNSLILLLIIGIFTISYFVKYPNTISCQVSLNTTEPQENIYANMDGTFLKMNLQDGAIIDSGEIIAIITNHKIEFPLKSKVSGQVHFIDFWKAGHKFQQGDLLFTVVPSNHGCYIGKLKVPMENLTKISQGQKVRIYVSENKMLKENIIEGTIDRISTVPDQDGFFSVEVSIGEELKTINSKYVNYVPGTNGKAEIIVEDLRLIERLFYQLRNIFKN